MRRAGKMNIEKSFKELKQIEQKLLDRNLSFAEKIELVTGGLKDIEALRDYLTAARVIAPKLLQDDLTLTPFK